MYLNHDYYSENQHKFISNLSAKNAKIRLSNCFKSILNDTFPDLQNHFLKIKQLGSIHLFVLESRFWDFSKLTSKHLKRINHSALDKEYPFFVFKQRCLKRTTSQIDILRNYKNCYAFRLFICSITIVIYFVIKRLFVK